MNMGIEQSLIHIDIPQSTSQFLIEQKFLDSRLPILAHFTQVLRSKSILVIDLGS